MKHWGKRLKKLLAAANMVTDDDVYCYAIGQVPTKNGGTFRGPLPKFPKGATLWRVIGSDGIIREHRS